MAEATKFYLWEYKLKAGTKVYVKTFFYSDANASEKFYGMITNVLPNNNIGVEWDIDNTHSNVSPKK